MWGRGKPMAVSQGGVTSGQTSGQGTEEMDHFEQVKDHDQVHLKQTAVILSTFPSVDEMQQPK
ncbi:hypothetical protein F751_4526 [Auxenochlorella protothecoides]|uniref:Uncharacterized protein n=1 Tax=Auxenochlorella protothecoides TaxID=3075 RepID=A0A087SNF2_AUXPR|nr:hypothetical protein F751_4526 [Auxenochlorella protothecoides]KFM27256.1 hypothetical protein F751_4526 [Auxenochlorella protothecoides]